MRELLMEEYQYVAGGSDSSKECQELADTAQNTITADGMLAAAAAATLIPTAGPLIGGAIAAASLIAGSLIGDAIQEACENHNQTSESTS